MSSRNSGCMSSPALARTARECSRAWRWAGGVRDELRVRVVRMMRWWRPSGRGRWLRGSGRRRGGRGGGVSNTGRSLRTHWALSLGCFSLKNRVASSGLLDMACMRPAIGSRPLSVAGPIRQKRLERCRATWPISDCGACPSTPSGPAGASPNPRCSPGSSTTTRAAPRPHTAPPASARHPPRTGRDWGPGRPGTVRPPADTPSALPTTLTSPSRSLHAAGTRWGLGGGARRTVSRAPVPAGAARGDSCVRTTVPVTPPSPPC